MTTGENQRRRTIREQIAAIFGWLSAGFAGLFVLAVALFLTGFGDLREGGGLGMAAFLVTVPPTLFFGAAWLILRITRKAGLEPREPNNDLHWTAR